MNISIHGLIFNQFTGKLYEMDNIKYSFNIKNRQLFNYWKINKNENKKKKT